MLLTPLALLQCAPSEQHVVIQSFSALDELWIAAQCKMILAKLGSCTDKAGAEQLCSCLPCKGSNYPSISCQDRQQRQSSEVYIVQVASALLCLQVCYRSYSAYRHSMRMTLRASTPYIATSCSSSDCRLTVPMWFTVCLHLRASAQSLSCLPCNHKKRMSGHS